MSTDEVLRADEIDVNVTNPEDLPKGWEKTHEEYRKPVKSSRGYYIYTYESEHFLVSQDVDKRGGETCHHVTLFKVKRGEDGEKLTSIGTGVFYIVGVEDGRQAFHDGVDNVDWDDNEEAHKEAEQAAFQVAVNLMKEVNNGEYKDKRYSQN